MRNPNYYLGEGKFTKIDEHVQAKAREIRGSGKDAINRINDYVGSLTYQSKDGQTIIRGDLNRNRSAGQVIKDGFVSHKGTDYGLVLVALARAKGIPAIFIEALEMRPKGSDCFPNVVFSDIFLDEEWVPFHPGYGRTIMKNGIYLYRSDPTKLYKKIAEGLDFSQLYEDEYPEKIIQIRTSSDFKKYNEKAIISLNQSPLLA